MKRYLTTRGEGPRHSFLLFYLSLLLLLCLGGCGGKTADKGAEGILTLNHVTSLYLLPGKALATYYVNSDGDAFDLWYYPGTDYAGGTLSLLSLAADGSSA